MFANFLKSFWPIIIVVVIIILKFLKKKNIMNGENVINVKPKSILKDKLQDKKNARYVLWGVIGAIIIILIALSVVVIPAGTTGVYHLFGKVRDREISSGIHLINPLARVTKMSIRTEEYTMTSVQGEGQKKDDDSIVALTREGLNISLEITVLYHLMEESASDVYRDVGLNYEEKIIRPKIRSAIRGAIAQYEAKDVYSEKRDEVTGRILSDLEDEIGSRGIGVEQVLLRNVVLPEKLAASIQEKLTAEQEAQKFDFILEREIKEAERKRIEARGQRDAQTIINESLTTDFLKYLYIKELKDREGTIYVPTSPNTGLPLFRDVAE